MKYWDNSLPNYSLVTQGNFYYVKGYIANKS